MYTELHLHTEYSFLDGGSPQETLIRQAATFGYTSLAVTDHDNLSGSVKFCEAARAYGIRPILGAEVTFEDETHLTLLAETPTGYANLCTLLSIAYHEGGRRSPRLPWKSLPDFTGGIICLSGCRRGRLSQQIAAHRYQDAEATAKELRQWFGPTNLYIELQHHRTPDSRRICGELAELADTLSIPVVATNNVHYATEDAALAHDVLRCIATGITIDTPHRARPFNREQRLKSASEMAALFAWRPDAIANTLIIAERCSEVLPSGLNITPRFIGDAPATLRELTYSGGLRPRPPLTPRERRRLEYELSEICERGYADYFLMVYDLMAWATSQGMHCPLRGSALDCYLTYRLGFTDVNALERDLPFVRFMSEFKTPDIDIDFASSRWYEVFRYMRAKYGEEHVAVCCVHSTYQGRGTIRDVGKVMALPKESLDVLASHLSHMVSADDLAGAFDRFAELKPHAHLKPRFALLFSLCKMLADFPRHLGSHSSGLVVSRVPLTSIAPVMPSAREVVPIWTLDKDDCETLGAIKLDVLALRMLSAAADAEADIQREQPDFRFDTIPEGDSTTYAMFQSGTAIGTFQFESSAQLALSVRLLPNCAQHLDAAVALIRPGPVRGNAVNEYVAAVRGWKKPEYPHPVLIPILEKTHGLIIFQEQLIGVLAAMMGCSDTEADRLRKSLKKHAKQNTMGEVRADFVAKALARHRDLTPKIAHRLFDQIEGWSGYGFTEGHAAAFALTGYRTAFLSVHHPAAFYAALLNAVPLGFYSANSYAAEARRRGVQILGVHINESGETAQADGEMALRLGFRQVAGWSDEDCAAVVGARAERPFLSLLDFCSRVVLRRDRLETLIFSGAFDSLHDEMRGLLFALDETVTLAQTYRAEQQQSQGAFGFGLPRYLKTPCADVPDFTPFEKFCGSWRATGVSAECHVFAYYREQLAAKGFSSAYDANRQRHGTKVRVAGITIRPHRPPTKSGRPVLFVSAEDESGIVQMLCLDEAIEKYTAVFLLSAAVMVEGILERREGGATLRVTRAKPFDPARLGSRRSGIAERDANLLPDLKANEPAGGYMRNTRDHTAS